MRRVAVTLGALAACSLGAGCAWLIGVSGDTEIAKLELNDLFSVGNHFVFDESCEDVTGVNVLMRVIVNVKEMYRLQQPTRYGHKP